ncbi:MAG: hypothetical protein LQ348_003845 [Seirophora lacunosa]|nr:MAG: hypothetical protein LQ348_003845 [Seirophora lacunosa]
MNKQGDLIRPQPLRPSLKRPLGLENPSKRLCRSKPKPTPTSLPLPTPSVSHHDSSSQHSKKSALPLKQSSPALERPWEDESSHCSNSLDHFPSKRRCREHSVSLTSTVAHWLSEISEPTRPSTVPPSLPSTTRPNIRRPSSAPTLCSNAPTPPFEFLGLSMSQSIPRPPSAASTSNTKRSTSDPSYRELIFRNGIILDPTGLQVDENEDIKTLLEERILSKRDIPLPDEQVKKIIKKAADLLDNAEGKAGDLIDTDAFPLERPGNIAEGRNVQWSTEALPTNPRYPRQLSAPKPDRHYGYPVGRKFEAGWADEEMAVIDHRAAQPYTQPTRDNCFPFMALEFKSEATGGSLYVAENQGVSSGVHMVASRRWLLKQAYPSKDLVATDAVAFVVAISPRTGVFYAVWYSDEKNRYIMSKIRVVSFMESFDIQRCRDIVQHIAEYGLGTPLLAIRKALAELDPPPPHWKRARSASSVSNTVFASDEMNKSQKR